MYFFLQNTEISKMYRVIVIKFGRYLTNSNTWNLKQYFVTVVSNFKMSVILKVFELVRYTPSFFNNISRHFWNYSFFVKSTQLFITLWNNNEIISLNISHLFPCVESRADNGAKQFSGKEFILVVSERLIPLWWTPMEAVHKK